MIKEQQEDGLEKGQMGNADLEVASTLKCNDLLKSYRTLVEIFTFDPSIQDSTTPGINKVVYFRYLSLRCPKM